MKISTRKSRSSYNAEKVHYATQEVERVGFGMREISVDTITAKCP